ncbi:unnamed protein product [Arctia plantaginis]|uniref:FP protein C-terminal domain-containing protein n=1 Tax=Arctia plantaginis TaxID=874455 RepID=A0A8S0ZJX7_ARCPL|nr:unnamed protein product [Arctia plantaginis]
MENISNLLEQKLNASLSHLMDQIRTVVHEEVKKQVQVEIRDAMKQLKEDFTSTTDFICADQRDLRAEINSKMNTIKALERNNSDLQKEINTLNNRISVIEKISRGQNLELQAVPESRNENLVTLIKNLCTSINFQIDDSSILSCRRVAKINSTSDRPRNIIVTLSNSTLRDQILSACRRLRNSSKEPLNSTHVGITSKNCNIYVSEHLSPECKALHAATRKKAKEINYKFVWVKFGRVYVRKTERTDHIHIKNMDSLDKLT